MLNRLTRSRRFAVGCVAALLVLGVLARTTTAFNPQPDPPGYGMVGIVEGQTARLNLVNLGTTNPLTPPDPCRARLQFFDGEGNALAGKLVTLKPGQAAFLDYAASFTPTNIGDVVGPTRAEIRGAVNTETGALPPPCRTTLEIFDNATGKTAVFIPPPCRGGGRCQGPQ
jgi:hypothetical protein